MKIFHASDLHYCQKHLSQVDRAFSSAVDHAIGTRADCAVIAGDSFDAAIHLHEPAVTAFLKQIARLAEHMPVLVLQGTFSHDRPGSLNVLNEIGGQFPVYVADKAEQVYLTQCNNWASKPDFGGKIRAVFKCLPSLNKAAPEIQEKGAHKYVEDLFYKWVHTNSVPSILVSHGTVNGCVTESKHAMISPDHEFTTDQLFSSGCDAVMLGHIHKHQSWSNGVQLIGYPGSITRLVFGHNDPVGFLMWDVVAGGAAFDFFTTPAPQLIDVTFPGAPVMSELETIAAVIGPDDHVRIRFSIDQDYAHQIDKDAIKELFENAGVLKIEGTVNPVQSVRAAGIGRAMSLPEKLSYWAVTTGDEDRIPELVDRLEMLQSMDVDQICETFERKTETKEKEQAA